MAEVTERGSGNGNVRIIDPNPRNENVNHEDLMIYVKLSARVKGRSILTEEDDQITSIENVITSSNSSGEVNYTYPQGAKNLTTDWTKIGGGTLKAGEDVGAFGIVGVDIDIKSSFTPQVVINFVDVRGATLFEQGPCSQYASFFHMPYPVFELTVKGFYGKPVKYTLALRKFNTKFNPSTGNFEIKGEFVGYTYAFLADIVMGYALAAPNMEGGKDKLKTIWGEYLTKKQETNQMVKEPVTIIDMLKDINDLEKRISDTVSSTDFSVTQRLTNISDDIQQLGRILDDFNREIIEIEYGPEVVNSEYSNGGKTKFELKQKKNPDNSITNPIKTKKLVKDYFGDGGVFTLIYEELRKTDTSSLNAFGITLPSLKKIDKIIKQNALYNNRTNYLVKGTEKYYTIDVGESFIKVLDDYKEKLNQLIEKQKEYEANVINETVISELKYMPTVRNSMMILLSNTELFLQQLVDASREAETYHERNTDYGNLNGSGSNGILGDGSGDDKQKIYPWPEYYEKQKPNKGGGSVLTYPGENPNLSGWPEVKFVEDFLISYLKVNKELQTITGEVDNLNGFNNYIPLNPIESPLFDSVNQSTTSNGYYQKKDLTEIYKTIGQRAFLVGDYTLMNGLTAWKSRYGYTETSSSPLSTIFNENEDFGRLTTVGLMNSYGYIDGVNFVKTIESEKDILDVIKLSIDNNTLGNLIRSSLGDGYTESTFTEWVTEYGLGVSETNIKNKLISKYSDYTIGDVVTYSKTIDFNGNDELKLKSNDLSKFTIIDGETINPRNLTIDEQVRGSVEKSKLYSNFKEKLDDIEKTVYYKDEKGFISSFFSDNETSPSTFNLNDSTKIPHINEDFKSDFLSVDEFSDGDDDTYYGLGRIFYVGGPGINFDSGENDDTLVSSPLWYGNLVGGQPYRDMGGITQNSIIGQQSNETTSKRALSYLTLCTMGGETEEGSSTWLDEPGKYNGSYNTISTLFKSNSSMVSIPKGFVLLTGAILWRMKESGDLPEYNGGTDPIIWDDNKLVFGDVRLKKFESYHWPRIDSTLVNPSKQSFTFINSENDDVNYIDVRSEMKTLMYLPKSVKDEFIKTFTDWSDGVWSNTHILNFDPVNFGGQDSSFGYYKSEDGTLVITTKNNGIQTLHNELYDQFYVIGFTTPKTFLGISESDLDENFHLRSTELSSFISGWYRGFKSVYESKKKSIRNNEDGSVDSSKRLINDPDIKLNLYRSFKSIYDKWISTSKGGQGTTMSLFYNRTDNNDNDTKSLLDHFQFVDRSFTDVGDKAVIDVTQLKDLSSNPTTSLYQTVAQLLSKNNFDFFPLPSFINFGNKQIVKKEELEQMFEPVTNLDNVNSSPSFVCMYIGGTSSSLDMVKPKQAMCQGGQIKYNYEDDGTALKKDMTGINGADDLENGNVTAFLVSYGIENQSHFKSISLDQAEFKETNESLLVIDQLAKGGNENNRVSKGQNLYNVYQTRSYTCEVESLGNMMIQPMMYFQLENVPMFHGAYLITEVRHNVKPHNMTTTFSGVRVPRVTIPLVTDAFTSMILPESDINGSSGSLSGDLSRVNYVSNFVDPDVINKLGFQQPIKTTVLDDGTTFEGVYVTSSVGYRNLRNTKASNNHKGVDLRATPGTPIYAVGDGELEIVRLRGNGFGLHIIIKHKLDNVIYRSLYAHLSDVSTNIVDLNTLSNDEQTRLINEGLTIKKTIKKGDQIGLSGGHTGAPSIKGDDFSGTSTAPHLHFEIRETKDGKSGYYSKNTIPKDPISIIDPEGLKTKYKNETNTNHTKGISNG
jgi:murein DD-endopeptidase MepM/ murein hydrolase activator NlpD